MYLCVDNTDYSISLPSMGTNTTLWHMSEQGMKLLHSKNLLPGLKQVDLDFCEKYVNGKEKRVKFVRLGKEKKNGNLELMHSSVWGPT